MQRAIELDILHAKLNFVRERQRDHEGRITALETKTSPPQPSRSPRSSIDLKRLMRLGKALAATASFLFRHGGIILLGITTAWAFILPGLQKIWRLITGFIEYALGVGIGV